MITNPVTNTFLSPGDKARINWISNDSSAELSGDLMFELMNGSGKYDMVPIYTIAESVDASQKSLSWTVPDDIPESQHFAIRVTDMDGNENYSHTFSGGLAQSSKEGSSKKSPNARSRASSGSSSGGSLNRTSHQSSSKEPHSNKPKVMGKKTAPKNAKGSSSPHKAKENSGNKLTWASSAAVIASVSIAAFMF
ncbi:hypothetical protein H4219_001527 [Mycoemilia scoparia]|uniref:Yeast cell wall synthesis Kre9/Knh1-like N-terminal domain-containing protein n=1 Tax=Mycoemilia scoparia TaxID=417184 RepID=A0A9W8A6H0_9FUNG|nr:hypothetical protein H4219_001527 [Mycoemilia scoparia]